MPRRYNLNPLKKDFDLTELPDASQDVTNKVSKTGDTMSGDLNFNDAGINNANQVTFNTSASETISEGVLAYNQNTGNLELGLAGGQVSVPIGKGLILPRRVKNTSGTTMTKGTVVYISGVQGNTPIVSRSLATSDATSAFTIGLCAEDISDNSTGWIVFQGELSGINLSAYQAGDTLYLSGTNAGQMTNVISLAPTHYVRIGVVTKATASGEMIVNIINGFELDEIHDVKITNIQDKEIIQYSDGLWRNTAPSGILISDLGGVKIQTPASGNLLTFSGVNNNLVNVPSMFVSFYGLLPQDPVAINTVGIGVRNGDNYWNTLDEKMQVFIDKWRELNGADRLYTEGEIPLQAQNGAYLQVQFQWGDVFYVLENSFPSST